MRRGFCSSGPRNRFCGCSFEVDHLEGLLAHLENHDLTYVVAVARAPIEEIEALRKQMDWKFPWVSFYIKPAMEDLSGDSVFFKDDAGQVFHTYSTFGRGGEQFVGPIVFLT